jgi:hypothetical protein
MRAAKLLRIRHLFSRSKIHIALTPMLCCLVKVDDANVSIPLKDIAFSKITVMQTTPVKFTKLMEDFHPKKKYSEGYTTRKDIVQCKLERINPLEIEWQPPEGLSQTLTPML